MDKKHKKGKSRRKQFHEELEGFDIRINEFGEIKSNYDVDKLNKFLNQKLGEQRLPDSDQQEEE